MPMPVEPVRPNEPAAPPAGSTQAARDLYQAQKAQYDKDVVAYAVALDVFHTNMQDYHDQHAYLAQLSASLDSGPYERHLRLYDAQGRLVIDQGFKGDNSVKSLLVNEQFDVAGSVLRYRTETFDGDHIRNDFTITQRVLAKGLVQDASSGQMEILSGEMRGDKGAFATSTNVYDANGNLVGVNYSTAGDAPQTGTSNKFFILDATGNVLLSREQSHNSPTAEQHQILANGQLQLRYSTHYGSFRNLEDEQEEAFWKAYNDNATQSLISPSGDGTVAGGANGTTGQVVVVAEGDSLQSIAARVYGSPDAWYRIADANNLRFDSVLVAGQSVVAPAAAVAKNTLEFDLGKVVGSTAPNLPPPPPPDKTCAVLVMIAVAVAVAVIAPQFLIKLAAPLVGGGARSSAPARPG